MQLIVITKGFAVDPRLVRSIRYRVEAGLATVVVCCKGFEPCILKCASESEAIQRSSDLTQSVNELALKLRREEAEQRV